MEHVENFKEKRFVLWQKIRPPMDEEYAKRHEKFVSNLQGTSFWEIQLVTAVGPLSILLRNLAVPWLFPMKNFSSGSSFDKICKLLFDYILTVVPTLLALTLFSERVASLVVLLVTSCTALAFFCLCEYFYLGRDRPKWRDVWLNSFVTTNSKPHFITYFRAYMLIATAVSILAVDFPCFPRRFAKTETWGYGLMDIGVGMFVVVSGIVSREVRFKHRHPFRTLPRRVLTSLPLIVMGICRLLAVKSSGYHEHVSEYGVHWNFFFTLAAVKILISLVASIVPLYRCSGVMSVILIVTYEYSLKIIGLENLLLYGTLKTPGDRLDFFNANKEGIVSLAGYLALYLAGLRIGYVLLKPRRRLKDWLALLAQFISYSFLSYLALTLSEVYVGQPSRRLANFTYCVWMIFMCFSHVTLFLAVELLAYFGSAIKLPIYISVQDQHNPMELVEPCLWQAVNKRGLLYFLIANLLTGAVNFLMPTIDADEIECVTVLSLYTFILSTLVFVQHAKASSSRQ